jgi:hypothetical protein
VGQGAGLAEERRARHAASTILDELLRPVFADAE